MRKSSLEMKTRLQEFDTHIKKLEMKKVCKKCGDLQTCHYCGRSSDNRGWAKIWRNKKDGPQHCICPSCAE